MGYLKDRGAFGDYNRLWAEALKREDGTYSERLANDEAEREFWKRFMARRQGYVQDEGAAQIMDRIRKRIEAYGMDDILEIGPGWGNYTLGLSRLCRELTCVDISADVLDYIKDMAVREGCNNIVSLAGKWEEVKLVSRYDMIFGYNCFYRMLDLEGALGKMNQSANKLCLVGMSMGMRPPYCEALEERLGVRAVYEKKDYIYFLNILYGMGIDANVEIVPLSKKKVYKSLGEAADAEARELMLGEAEYREKKKEIETALSRYWTQTDDGNWAYEYHYRGALVYWEPR